LLRRFAPRNDKNYMDNQSPSKTTPKDVFLHLLSIITLYFSAGNFIALLFQYINSWLPQFPEAGYYYSGTNSIMRFAIASLIVVFPSYLLTVWYLNKDYLANPAKLKLAIRRWLIYFTLFITALIIIGDLVALINRLLEGEYTLQFLLKVLTVFFATGAIFVHYWRDLQETASKKMKYFNYFIIGAVAAAIIAGFFMIGSPAKQRQLQFDDRRINDLSYLQSEILYYWQNKETLPAGLSLLKDDLRGVNVPVDPENGSSYGYEVKGLNVFALCATFNLPSVNLNKSQAKPAPYYGDGFMGQSTWEHQTGMTCFERTIDEDFYKLKRNVD